MKKPAPDSEEKRQKACFIVLGHMVIDGVCQNCGWREKREDAD